MGGGGAIGGGGAAGGGAATAAVISSNEIPVVSPPFFSAVSIASYFFCSTSFYGYSYELQQNKNSRHTFCIRSCT